MKILFRNIFLVLLFLFLSKNNLHAQNNSNTSPVVLGGSCASPDGPMKDYTGGQPSYATANGNGWCYGPLTAGQTYCYYFYYPTNTTLEIDWKTNCSSCESTLYMSINSNTGAYTSSMSGTCTPTFTPGTNCIQSDISGSTACTDCAPELYDKNCALIHSNGFMGGTGCPMTYGDKYTYCFKVPAGCGGTYVCPLVKCATGGCASLMPIELLSFTGKSLCEKNILNWTTATEKDNSYFTVERSIHGSDYEPIGSVKGAGNSNMPMNYEFMDTQVEASENDEIYYRLKQTDYDGKFEYFGPIEIKTDCGNDISIYPTLTNGSVTIHSGKNQPKAIVNITDALGRKIISENIPDDWTEKIIDLSKCEKGIYFIRILSRSENFVRKIVVF